MPRHRSNTVSDAPLFLLIPLLAAIAGSLIIYVLAKSRRPVEPGFQDQLRAIAPDERSRPHSQPTGIVTLDDQPSEEA